MKEQLYDGPYDGLEWEPLPGENLGSTVTWQGLHYERRVDGRLYLRGSKWDLLPRKHDRL